MSLLRRWLGLEGEASRTENGESASVRRIAERLERLPLDQAAVVSFTGLGADGPEDRGLAERCLIGFNSGPPMMPSAYNNNMQLFQTDDHVVIMTEMVNTSRIVPIDGPDHIPTTIPTNNYYWTNWPKQDNYYAEPYSCWLEIL